ncbi:hypothetical protein Syn7502_01572 [Synechococcus sp. PCC 7502]|uniref:hypothetical protein n=1 Tax=Synechococcus sp. PCC 7502 TaxID=1173263 RepID=UPI00029FE1C0|nr:hypothetical protein [Synechococcus sp. PCC 7502]AFY73632.1 hypothetical protein Syn7502_01572 [Synechococcus sp. PCC 7502]
MKITTDNVHEAENAIRDILYMYYDLVKSYKGFGHNIESGKFNPLNYIDAVLEEPIGYTFAVDIELLQNGSAVALLCDLVNMWDEFETSDVQVSPIIDQIKAALVSGRFRHLPEFQKAIELGLGNSEEAFRKEIISIYQKHVCGYFNRMKNQC